jgi:hypothetical protein
MTPKKGPKKVLLPKLRDTPPACLDVTRANIKEADLNAQYNRI